jgi:digeranylgeranylglycerophospholipid reductase
MREKADAVIVGCGIAGGQLARYLAASGFKVIAVEKRPQVGVPIRCAEAAGSRRELSHFIEIDERWICAEINGARLISPSGISVERRIPGAGVMLRRDLFDQALAEQASLKGADIRTNTEALDLEIEGGFVKGVRLLDHSRQREYRVDAGVTVGADGIESFVGLRAGLRRHLKLNEMHSCCQHLMRDSNFPADTIHIHIGRKVAPGGYAWVFPKGAGYANVGIGILPGMSGGRNAKEYLDSFIDEQFPDARIVSTIAGGTSGIKPLKSMVGNGILLVGESAGHNNSFSGGGIMNALEGAEEAALVLKDALARGDVSSNSLRTYDENWTERNGKTLAKFAALRKFFSSLEDRDLDNIASVASNLQDRELGLDYTEFFKLVFQSAPGLIWKARKLLW